jgi:hypothetical protein
VKRSLTNVGGAIETEGDREAVRLLANAVDVKAAPKPKRGGEGDDEDRAHVHGFHSYPARMHPVTAARLVRAFAPERGVVLDPFCGSGTVLVEAMIAGRRAVGTDLNPLAVKLARLKTTPRAARARDAIVETAREIAARADERRLRRAGATRRYPREDVELFDPHVLLELDGLRAGIEANLAPDVRDALELVLSAILVKVSRRPGDTAAGVAPRRLASGFTLRLFVRKSEELARRLGELAALLPAGTPAAHVELDDATRLRTVARASVDAVVTSPPYVGTYDYLVHHALRMRWLGLDTRAFARGEMGSRRRYASLSPRDAREAWTRELSALLASLARVVRPRAPVVLLLADSVAGTPERREGGGARPGAGTPQRSEGAGARPGAGSGEPLRADALVATLAPRAGFTPVARASQHRPHFHAPTARAFRASPRAEHALLLERT